MSASWSDAAVQPAARAGDSEFLRRVSLDLAGTIPAVAETRAFLADTSPDKRRKLVDQLLARGSYVRHFTNVWHSLVLPETATNQQLSYVAVEFDAWLRKQLAENVPCDQMVRDILTVPLLPRGSGAYAYYSRFPTATPTAFFAAKESEPENLAAATARVFLGIRVECAQCHDHPFAPWKQDQFWEFAAFYDGIKQQPRSPFSAIKDLFGLGKKREMEIAIPGTDRFVAAHFVDGNAPDIRSSVRPRELLAEWIVSKNNPYFARAAVNRTWDYFFGMGLVDPVDNMEPSNPPSHPELLDALSEQFVTHDFDMKFLIRSIVLSQPYQLSSALSDPGQLDPRQFARMVPRAMTADQLVDSLTQAIGQPISGSLSTSPFFGNPDRTRLEFRQLVDVAGEKATQRQTSVLQALALMNGKLVSDATGYESGTLLPAVVEMPGLDDQQRIEILFLAALSRKPRPDELRQIDRYAQNGGEADLKSTLADVFWTLPNSSEFAYNH